jgi:hypothetical protein
MNSAQWYGYVFNIVTLNRKSAMPAVTDKHEPVLWMGPYNALHHLMGEPADAVAGYRPECSCINGNNHFLLPIQPYKCGN